MKADHCLYTTLSQYLLGLFGRIHISIQETILYTETHSLWNCDDLLDTDLIPQAYVDSLLSNNNEALRHT